MEIELTPEQDSFIHLGIKEGRFRNEAEAVRQAMALWEERERRRLELIAAIEEGLASFEEQGAEVFMDSDDDVHEWMAGISRRGRTRLAER